MRKGLEVRAIDTALSHLKQTTAHFGKSPADCCLLEAKQELLGLKKERLINDCVTRWNTTYDMICRASEQQAAMAAVIFEKKMSHLELSTSEWSVVEQLKHTETIQNCNSGLLHRCLSYSIHRPPSTTC